MAEVEALGVGRGKDERQRPSLAERTGATDGRADVLCLLRAPVEALDGPTVDDVGVEWIGREHSTLAAYGNGMFVAKSDRRIVDAATGGCDGAAILLRAVEPVRI